MDTTNTATNGYSGIFTPPTTSEEADKALVRIVCDRWDSSQRWYKQRKLDAVEWYRSYKAEPIAGLVAHRNNIAIPLAHAIVQTDLARKVSSLFASWPIVTFEGYGPGDSQIAQKSEVLVSAQLKDCKSFMKGLEFLTNADIYGTGIARVGWKNIKRLKMVRQQWLDKVYNVPTPVTLFDGPDWGNIHISDAAPQPGKRDIETSRWFAYRYYIDYDDLVSMNGGPIPLFKPSALIALKNAPLAGDGMNEYMNRFLSSFMRGTNTDAIRQETYAKPVCIKEMIGFVPSEFAPDGVTMRMVTIANDRVLLRNDPNPYDTDRIPIIACSPVHDTEDFFGISKVYLIAKLQGAISRMLNVRLDVLDLFGNPQWVGDSTRMANNQNMNSKPGRIYQVRGNPRDVLMPIVPDLSGFSHSAQESEYIFRLMQLGSGMIEEQMMGGFGPNRQSAREYLGKQEAVLNRVSLESMICSYELLEPLAEWFRDMNRSWLPLPKQMKIMGSAAEVNEITGLPYPQEPPMIVNGDLDHDFRAKAVGPMMMLTKTAARSDALQLAQVMGQNPVWGKMVNWANFARKIFSVYDWDATAMLVSQVPQINQFADQAGQSPEDFLNAAASPISGGASGQMMGAVSPDMIGNQSGAAPLGMGP